MESEDTTAIGLSIIIPVYNAELYLSDGLQSVISQKGADFEIICVDDFSDDRSVDIVQQAMSRDARISLHRLAKNSGAPVARNHGIDASQGRYLLFMDADDQLIPGSLGQLYQMANELDSDAIKGCIYVI
jgi:glycosyltransferase involved in cell wall biosynthesis